MSEKKSGLKVAALVVGSLFTAVIFAVLLGLGLMALVFAILPGEQQTTAEVTVVVLAADGQPQSGLEVELWGYEQASQRGTTNARGEAVFRNQSFSFSKSILSPRRDRPREFTMRARFPERTELYYRWNVKKSGELEYDIFDDSYDYYFGGHWLGRFRGDEQTTQTIKDMGKLQRAKSLTDVKVPLKYFESKADLRRSETGPEPWFLRLELRATAADHDGQ